MFPYVRAANLERRPVVLPDDFAGGRNLVNLHPSFVAQYRCP